MNTATRISLITTLALTALVAPACDDSVEPRADADAPLSVDEIEAIYVAVDEAAERDEARDEPALEGPQTLVSPIDPALGCGWEYGVCMSWCLANNWSNECFSFCHDEFC